MSDIARNTAEIAERLVNIKFPVNATFDKQPEAREFADMPIVQVVSFGLETGQPVAILSSPGGGKTSFVKAMAKSLNVQLVYIPAATISPEDLAVPMPVVDPDTGVTVLDFLLYEELLTDRPKIILIDEPSRATKAVKSQVLEIVQERSLGGVPIKNIVGMFACDNESAEDGITDSLFKDLAQATRWLPLRITTNDTPWRRALAERFDTTDLTGVFKVYARLSAREKYLLSPRTLEHVLYNLLNGHPGVWALPLHSGTRDLLVNEAGKDRTKEILGDIAAALGTTNRDSVPDPVKRAIASAISDGVNIIIEGGPGIGKTSFVKEAVRLSGCQPVYISAPVIGPDDLAMPYPIDGKLSIMIMKALSQPGRKVIILDEIWRCSAAMRSKLMEILQEGSVGGIPIRDLVCVIAMTNPKEIAGFKMDVGRPDRAQADRFFMSVQAKQSDIPAIEWLLKTYGVEAEPFVEWWKNDIDDLARVLITMRNLELMIKLRRSGLPLTWGKPFVNGDSAPVPLHDLEARLAKRELAKLREIARDAQGWLTKMSGNPVDPVTMNAHTQVYTAFAQSELSQLEDNVDTVVLLLSKLMSDRRIALIRPGGEKQVFWRKALTASAKLTAAAKAA